MVNKPSKHTHLKYQFAEDEFEDVNVVHLIGYEEDNSVRQKFHRTVVLNNELDLGENCGCMLLLKYNESGRIVGIEILYDDAEDFWANKKQQLN
ncbi:MAG: hypothetical protein QNJ29_07005 [Rhizobiaceae bacterium]|nr:hypothetical protein [Rhizobiaceae bacterium]